MILQKAEGQTPPISKAIQSESFQDFCSRRLYDLNRREGELKDVALSFAEASHALLLRSHRENSAIPNTRDRLRQYMSIYVRITTGDVKWQYERVRELIDSGLFVFAGGSDTPRTKTKDSNPTQQFKLTYRKVYGLSNFIGLAESDRFELSGGQLEEWLRNPTKEVLMRNLGGDDDVDLQESEQLSKPEGSSLKRKKKQVQFIQPPLFEAEVIRDIDVNPEVPLDIETQQWLDQYIPSVEDVAREELADIDFAMTIFGLGFEERTFASAKRLSRVVRTREIALFRYPEPGRSNQIEKLARETAGRIHFIDYGSKSEGKPEMPSGKLLIDATPRKDHQG